MGLTTGGLRQLSFSARLGGNRHPSSDIQERFTTGRPSPMRVCHLINDLDPGGAERTLVNLVRHMNPAHFKNEVVSLIEPGVFGNDLRAAGIPFLSLGMRRGQASLSGLARLVRHLRQSRPTILQTWLYHADLLGTVAHFFAPSMKLLWNVRCSDIASAPGSDRLRKIVHVLARLSHRPDAVIVNSTPGRLFHEQISYRPRQWIELPNGVDTQQFLPRPEMQRKLRANLGIQGGGPTIGLVARYHPMKGHATFLRASANFLQAHPNARFVLCGKGCDEKNANLMRLIGQAGLSGRVILLGSRIDVDSVYSALDLLVLCSDFGEGFPNVLIEAMACGVPCVATDTGACREIITNQKLIVPPRDPAALAEAWEFVLGGPTEALAAKLRTHVVDNYQIDRICQLYESAYLDLVCAERASEELHGRLCRSTKPFGTTNPIKQLNIASDS